MADGPTIFSFLEPGGQALASFGILVPVRRRYKYSQFIL